jgi:hypothetical protein
MQPDGDLWHQFWNATLARGPQAIKISKVKGHSTDKDISEGKTTEHDRKGNDEADKAATSGTEAVMDGLVALAMWVQDRHASYCKFMHRVHTVIIAVHKAEKTERQERDKQHRILNGLPKHPTRLISQGLDSTPPALGRAIAMAPLPHGSHRFASFQTLLEQVHAYMSQLLFVQRGEGDTNGTTWIEIFADFEHSGYKQELTKQGLADEVASGGHDHESQRAVKRWSLWQHRTKRRALKRMPAKANVTKSIRAELEDFKSIFRFLILSSGDEIAKTSFCQNKFYRSRRLDVLGVQGHQPAVAASICFSVKASSMISEAILRQKAGMTSKERRRITTKLGTQGSSPIRIRDAKLITVGPPRWRAGASWPPDRIELPAKMVTPVGYSSRLLTCPFCDTQAETAHLQLRERQGIRGVWCRVCRNQRRASTWKCMCGVGWQTCTVHSVDPVVHNPARVARTRRGRPLDSIRSLLPHDRPAPSGEGVQKRRRRS